MALQDPEAERLLAGMSEQERMASWHLVSADGRVTSAGAAFVPLGRLLPGGAPLAAAAERFPRTAERAYRLVASNRSLFGKLITAGASNRARRRIAERAR